VILPDNFVHLKTLENLSITSNSKYFLIQQKVHNQSTYTIDRAGLQNDISSIVKFKLKKLELPFTVTISENLKKFLLTQADNLKELTADDDEILKFALENFKNLKKLKTSVSSVIYEEFETKLSLDSVEHFELDYEAANLTKIYQKFPNLKSLKCEKLSGISGTFEKLIELEVNILYFGMILNLKLPNLRKLKIGITKINASYPTNQIAYRSWNKFIKNIPNIENLIVEKICEEIDLALILMAVKNLKNLKIFKGNVFEEIDHKILVNFEEKSIDLDEFLYSECKTFAIVVNMQYDDFDLFEN
jgi:hypothetical protein